MHQNSISPPAILVLFNTVSGTTYQLAKAVAKGIQQVSGVQVSIKQVPRIHSDQAKENEFKHVPEATVDELTNYAAIAFGSPVHFGNMSADMRYFLDKTVLLWNDRKLEGIPATVFMASGSGAAHEAAILSFWNTLAAHGMTILPTGLRGTEELNTLSPEGNTVFGASSLTAASGKRPSPFELNIAQQQGYALASLTKAIHHYQTSLPV